jgi:hypothetical protein
MSCQVSFPFGNFDCSARRGADVSIGLASFTWVQAGMGGACERRAGRRGSPFRGGKQQALRRSPTHSVEVCHA